MSKSDYLEAALLSVLRGSTFPVSGSGSVYPSLHTESPADDASGTELTGNGYGRPAVAKSTGSWTAPGTGGSITNAVTISFPTATGDWSSATHFGVWDSPTGGNLLWHGALTGSVTVLNGEVGEFPAGDLTITET